MLRLAHRGASAEYPENAWLAFLAAYENGADGYELDVQVTLDQYAIVLHDPTLRRTAVKGQEWMPWVPTEERRLENLNRILDTPTYLLSFEDTQKINVGTQHNHESPPLLSKVLVWAVERNFFGLHEIKVDDPKARELTLKAYEEAVVEAARLLNVSLDKIATMFNLISFDDTVLEDLQNRLPQVELNKFWVREFRYNPKDALDQASYVFDPGKDFARAKEIGAHFDVESWDDAQAIGWIRMMVGAGFRVGTWVRGEPKKDADWPATDGDRFARLMASLGCEFFTSNLPEDMKK